MENLLTTLQKETLQQWLDSAVRIVLCAHTSPDGDAVGSTLGLYHLLKSLGKDVQVILPNTFPENLAWIPGAQDIVFFDKQTDLATQLLQQTDVIFCLDFNELSRVETAMMQALQASTAKKGMIDHHLNPSDECQLVISFPTMSSTCELVFRIIYELGLFAQISYESAQALYAGMCTDTGGFTFNSTRPEIFFIISCLLEKGIDKDKIYRNLFNNNSYNRLRMQGYVLYEKLLYYEKYQAALLTISKQEQQNFHFQKGDSEGWVNLPLTIKGMRLSCQLREDTELPRVLVSLRSVDDFPCNQMAAEFFNGGGHLNAAGGKLYCTLDEAVQVFKQAIEKYKDLLVPQK